LAAAALWLPSAQAALGAGLDSIQADQMRLSATRLAASPRQAQVHTLQWPDGSSVRQYSGADGRVYAVAWSTRTKPRLDQLLGVHFSPYAQAAREDQGQRPGPRHHHVVDRGDLVVEATAHGNAFVGRAYLKSLLPGGQTLDAVR
jgi:hypothetical protein